MSPAPIGYRAYTTLPTLNCPGAIIPDTVIRRERRKCLSAKQRVRPLATAESLGPTIPRIKGTLSKWRLATKVQKTPEKLFVYSCCQAA